MAGQSGNPGGRPKGLERLAREIVGGGTDLMQFYRDVFDGKPFMRKVVQLLPLRKEHQWGGEVLFYLCPGCRRPRRDLYPWQVIDGRLDRDLKPRCRECAGLRYLTQGIPGGGPSTEPWHPRAVSDARMVASEFPSSLVILPE